MLGLLVPSLLVSRPSGLQKAHTCPTPFPHSGRPGTAPGSLLPGLHFHLAQSSDQRVEAPVRSPSSVRAFWGPALLRLPKSRGILLRWVCALFPPVLCQGETLLHASTPKNFQVLFIIQDLPDCLLPCGLLAKMWPRSKPCCLPLPSQALSPAYPLLMVPGGLPCPLHPPSHRKGLLLQPCPSPPKA